MASDALLMVDDTGEFMGNLMANMVNDGHGSWMVSFMVNDGNGDACEIDYT